MIDYTKIDNMYNNFLDVNFLTTKELLAVGFNKNDLGNLIEQGILKRITRGVYGLSSVKGLFEYFERLLSDEVNDSKLGIMALERCLELDPTFLPARVSLLYNDICNERIYPAVNNLEFLLNNASDDYARCDYNYWLYLISFNADLDKYKDYIKKMTLDDIAVNCGDKYLTIAREKALEQKFGLALDITERESISKDINYLITCELIKLAGNKKSAITNEVYRKIRLDDFDGAKNLLEKINEYHNFDFATAELYKILCDFVKMVETNKIPVVDETIQVNGFNAAIVAKDYRTVFKTKNLVLYGNKINNRILALRHLLDKFEEAYMNLVNKDSHEIGESVGLQVDDAVAAKNKTKEYKRTSNNLFINIVSNFTNGNIFLAKDFIGQYLNYVGMNKYKRFIDDLVRVGEIDEDKSFREAMYVLSEISRGEFEFLSADYIQEFYVAMSSKEFAKAGVYLDILSMSGELCGIDLNVSDMRKNLIKLAQIHGVSEEELELDRNMESSDVVVTDSDVDQADISTNVDLEVVNVTDKKDAGLSEKVKTEVVDAIEEDKNEAKDTTNGEVTLYDIAERIVQSDNLIVLEPMNDMEIAEVLSFFNAFPKTIASVKSDDKGQRVTLRYYDLDKPYIDLTNTLKEANNMFYNWQYKDAINLYEECLQKIEYPKSFIYGRLAHCYARTTYDGDYSKAIDYYLMAKYLDDEAGVVSAVDYGALIDKYSKRSGYNGTKVTLECNKHRTEDGDAKRLVK